MNKKTSNISFTHSFNARRFLDMDMSIHPNDWRIYPPYMVFACHQKVNFEKIEFLMQNKKEKKINSKLDFMHRVVKCS